MISRALFSHNNIDVIIVTNGKKPRSFWVFVLDVRFAVGIHCRPHTYNNCLIFGRIVGQVCHRFTPIPTWIGFHHLRAFESTRSRVVSIKVRLTFKGHKQGSEHLGKGARPFDMSQRSCFGWEISQIIGTYRLTIP